MQARTSARATKRSTGSRAPGARPSAGVAIVFHTLHTVGQPVQYFAVDLVARHAATQPDKPAVIEGERRLSWREYHERRNRLADALGRLGLAAGEHVVLYAHNALEVLLASAAVRARGAVPVPMNHRLTAEEAAYILDDSDAVVLFASDAFLPMVE